MKKLVALAIVATLVLGVSSANALIITGNLTPSGQVNDAFGGGLGVLDVYTIVADNTVANGGTGTPVTAMDLTFDGIFAQVQNATFGTNTPSPKQSDVAAFGPDALAQDTHFLPTLVEPGPPIPPPTEGIITNGAPGSGLASGLLSSQVAIGGLDQAEAVAIAQIVVQAGTVPAGTFQGTIAIAGNSTPIPVAGVIGVPEPGTIALAGLSLVGFLANRRRLV